MMLKVRPSPDPDLPQLPRSPFLHAVLTTPVDRTGACRFLSLPARPSPGNWRVGVHIQTFEACSSFTRVTACKIAARPMADLFRGSDPASHPAKPLGSYHAYRQLHGWVVLPLEICAFGA